MADPLSDEDKAKLVAEDVESTADETQGEQEASTDTEQADQEVDGQTEEATEEPAPAEEPEAEAETETPPTFTKQFSNLKGDNWEDYGKSLEQAYQNSFNEALRLKKELDDSRAVIEQAKQVIATQPAQTTQPTQQPTQAVSTDSNLLTIDSHPIVQYAKAAQQRDMITAFDEFTKDYPQARDENEFKQFTAAADGVVQAYAASHNGVQPTYSDLYQGIANILGWEPVSKTAKKDATIKDATSSSQTVSSTQPTARQPKVSDAQVEAYMKMHQGTISREQAIKDLADVKV